MEMDWFTDGSFSTAQVENLGIFGELKLKFYVSIDKLTDDLGLHFRTIEKGYVCHRQSAVFRTINFCR